MNKTQDPPTNDVEFGMPIRQNLLNITHLVYALQSLGILSMGLLHIVAVIVNYVKIDDVRGTWLESHFRWQIRTFWFSLPWYVIGIITAIIFIGQAILFILSIWVIYRVIKGWMRLLDNKAMYVDQEQ